MRIVVIGATGTIGKSVVSRLQASSHEVVSVSNKSTPITVELADTASIIAMYRIVGKVDAVVCAAGSARFKPFTELSDEDYDYSLRNKLMGQVNVVRYGVDSVADSGSITLTSGVLARKPMPGGAAVSLVNAGLEGFVRAAALEAPRGIRVNVVSPPWVTETLEMLGMDTSIGLTPDAVAQAYVESVTGSQTGAVIEPRA